MTETVTTATDTSEVVKKPRKKRVWTDEQRKAMSRRVRKQWKLKKQAEGGNGNGEQPQHTAPPDKGTVTMKARLTAYGVNPNTGAVELHSQDLAEHMNDLLPRLIELLYNGSVMTEIRLEQR